MADCLIMQHVEKGKTRKLYVGPNWVLALAPVGLAILVAQYIIFDAFGGLIGGAAIGLMVAALIQGMGFPSMVKMGVAKLISKGWIVKEAQGDKAIALVNELRAERSGLPPQA